MPPPASKHARVASGERVAVGLVSYEDDEEISPEEAPPASARHHAPPAPPSAPARAAAASSDASIAPTPTPTPPLPEAAAPRASPPADARRYARLESTRLPPEVEEEAPAVIMERFSVFLRETMKVGVGESCNA